MNNEKTCCFYISIFHLFTMILPYIDEKMQEEKNIELLAQKDVSLELKAYLKNVEKLIIDKNRIEELNWKCKIKQLEWKKNTIYLVIGDTDYIKNYENVINENCDEGEIISCYKLNKNLDISNVLYNHDYLFTTKSKKQITKFSQNEQERKTIKSQ